jgi:hypothetical protein
LANGVWNIKQLLSLADNDYSSMRILFGNALPNLRTFRFFQQRTAAKGIEVDLFKDFYCTKQLAIFRMLKSQLAFCKKFGQLLKR